MRILLIYNPVSGVSRNREEKFGKILYELGRRNCDIVVYQTKSKGDATKYLGKHLEDEFDMLAVRGGDGTLHEIVNALMKYELNVPVAYLPAGSTNDYASNLGIKAKTAVKTLVSRKIRQLDIGKFNKEYFTYVAAFGIMTDLSFATPQKAKNSLGYLAYLMGCVKELKDMHSIHMKCRVDDGTIEDEFLVGMITNALSIAGVIKRKDKGAKLDDGLMEYIFIKYPKNPGDISHIIYSLMNSKFDTKYMYYGASRTFDIESDSMMWTLDGECGGNHKHVKIDTIPKAISIAVGKEYE